MERLTNSELDLCLEHVKNLVDLPLFEKLSNALDELKEFRHDRKVALDAVIGTLEKYTAKKVPENTAEETPNLDVVPVERLNHYCEISETKSIFLYEIRKIAREAKLARSNLSAQRWDALVSSPGIRILGSSGIVKNQNANGYAHFGMEIWTIHTGRIKKSADTEHGKNVLEKYADIMIENSSRVPDLSVAIHYNLGHRFGDKVQGKITGDGIEFEVKQDILEGILNDDTPGKSLGKLRDYVLDCGITVDVKLMLSPLQQ